MLNEKMKPTTIAVGAVFAGSLASAALANVEGDLFAADELDEALDLVADAHKDGGDAKSEDGDGSCGEGSCGEEEGSCGEGSCGEGSCGEGSCGEGSCGEGEDEAEEKV